jgi:acyl-CoA thioesterase-1
VRAFVTDGGVSGDTAARGGRGSAGPWTGWARSPTSPSSRWAPTTCCAACRRQTRADLDAILAELKRRGIPVLIAGMLAAPNLGPLPRRI